VQHATMATTRILIVEDEPLIRMFVADSLEEYGFEVAEAESATEALAKLAAANGAVEAVIIDVGLPDRPGDTLAEELRAKWKNLPIVIASGRDANEFIKRFSYDSRVAVLGKPYTTDMLRDALRKVGVTSQPSD
jgi:DNA-binding response OmpR family regulator